MRGKRAPKRKITPDIRYDDIMVAKFINFIMSHGKKSIAIKIVYDAFDTISEKTKQEPLEVFEGALKNVAPMVEVKGKRVGGANYQIPIPVRGSRRNTLAFRWIIAAAKERKGKPMAEKLALEIMDAFENTGLAIKKKQDVYRMAESNRAFAHFAR